MFCLLCAFVLFGAVVGDVNDDFNSLMMEAAVNSYSVLLKGTFLGFQYDFGTGVKLLYGPGAVTIYPPFKPLNTSTSKKIDGGYLLTFNVRMGDIIVRQSILPDVNVSGCHMQLNYEVMIASYDETKDEVKSVTIDDCPHMQFYNGTEVPGAEQMLPLLSQAVQATAVSEFTFNGTNGPERFNLEQRWSTATDYLFYMFNSLAVEWL